MELVRGLWEPFKGVDNTAIDWDDEASREMTQALKLDPSSKDASLERELFAGGAKPDPARCPRDRERRRRLRR